MELEEDMVTNKLMQTGGCLPSKDKRTFNRILKLIIKNWDLVKPADIMIANDMVSTWMRLKYAEEKIDELGVYFKDEKGLRMNPLTTYSRNLKNDLMRYYRLFQLKVVDSETGPKDFATWLEENAEDVTEDKPEEDTD